MHSLGPRVVCCWALWFKCVMACDLDALFQSAVLHVLPVVQVFVSSGHSPACLNFYLKYYYIWPAWDILYGISYMFDMTILSTWEETLAHQLGRKALGCAASVYLFVSQSLIPPLSHTHTYPLPTRVPISFSLS